jgi:Ankyrin repeat
MGDATELTRQHDLLRAVTGQIDWWWNAIFWPRLVGLSDEEFLWEPVDGCWTIHHVGEALTRVDFHWPPPRPAPVTTIAWRMHHLGVDCLARRASLYFPTAVSEPWEFEPYAEITSFPMIADAAVAFLGRWWSAWRRGLASLSDGQLWAPLGGIEVDSPEMQLGVDDPFIGMVLHQQREFMHHGAEICLLRDLYRAQQPADPFVDAVLRGDAGSVAAQARHDPGLIDRYRTDRPDLALRAAETGSPESVRLVAELGFDINGLVEGQTPLHHAAAGGHLALIHELVWLGADPGIEDLHYHATALGWAEHFKQDKAAAYLKTLGSSSDAAEG